MNKLSVRWPICSRLFSLALGVGLLLCAVAPVCALEQVSWTQLPYYLESRGIVPDPELEVCDCPQGLDEEKPTHDMAQVIANTLYEWREYEFLNGNGQAQLAVIMFQPQHKRLNQNEARLLLTASRVLLSGNPSRRAVAKSVTLPPVSSMVDRMPQIKDPLPLRGVTSQLDDNRIQVAASDLGKFPYNTIVFLKSDYPEGASRGSGCLAAPGCVLTAAHVIYEAESQEWPDNTMICPAIFNTASGWQAPYGTRTVDLNMSIYRPYQTNSECSDANDLGALVFDSPFAGIDTFIPIEFDAPLPAIVETLGYPGTVRGTESLDMWFATGSGLNFDGNQNRLLDFTAYVSPGASGSPLLVHSGSQYRNIGVVVCEGIYYNFATRFTHDNKDFVLNYIKKGTPSAPSYDYSHHYYLPYYETINGAWTGVALANLNNEANHIKLEYFAAGGAAAGSETLDLPAHGQGSKACAPTGAATGWIKISSTAPVYGIALVGDTSPSTMFDMDIKSTLHKKFVFPHLASDSFWSSTAMLCNPNPTRASVYFTYYKTDGTAVPGVDDPVSVPPIPANGSIAENLGELFGPLLNELAGGYLIVESSQPLAAFLLYDGTKTQQQTWKAGLSAVPLD